MLKRLRNVSSVLALALLLGFPTITHAQTLLNTTTLTNAITNTDRTFVVGSTTNIVAGSTLYIPRTGEQMTVLAIPVAGSVTVKRGAAGPFAAAATAAAETIIIVPVAQNAALILYNPAGACTRGTGLAANSPVINTLLGIVWVCRSSLWQGSSRTLVTYDSLVPFTP